MTISASFIRPAFSGFFNNFWRKYTPLTISTILLGSSPVFASLENVTVLNSSDREFHFVVTFENSQSLNRVFESDSLLHLIHTVQVCVPIGSTARLISANGSGSKSIEKISSAKQDVSLPLVQLSDKWIMRGREYVTVIVSPVSGNSIYSQVEVHLSFEGVTVQSSSSYDPFFDRMLEASVANWNECKNWATIPRAAAKSVAQPGPFAVAADWYKLEVNQTGMHAVTYAELSNAGLFQSSVPSSEIFIYNGGGEQLNPLLINPRPTFEQVAIAVEDGSDGTFQSGDRILFFGQALDRFAYDSSGAGYIKNLYTENNVYWLAVSSSISDTPLRMTSVNAAPTGTAIDTMESYREYVHVEQDVLLRQFNNGTIENYYDWYWAAQNMLSFFIPVSNVVPGQQGIVSLAAKTYDTTGSGGTVPGTYVDLTVNSQMAGSKICNGNGCTYLVNNLVNGMNQFNLRLWGSSFTKPYFDLLDLSYERFTVPVSNRIDAAFGPYNGLVQVNLTDLFSSTAQVFDLNDPKQPVRLTGAVSSSGVLSFESTFELNSANRFYAVGTNSMLSPVSVTQAAPSDLYSGANQTDLVLITTEAFSTSLAQYVNFRSAQGYSIELVTIEDIMDNFGFGLYDPTAIRDFLKHSYENYPSPAPSAVLFVGDGTYDFNDNLGTSVQNHVPPYLFQFDNTLSDDNYIYFGQYGIIDSDTSYVGGDRGFDMMPARWPAKTTAEISNIVSKIIQYESALSLGNWRNNVTIVADDEFAPANPPQVEVLHTQQAESLSVGHIPPVINKTKIYSWDYPLINFEKPSVNTAIVNSINDGTLIVNYVGHGNPNLWADEHIFNRTSDLPRLNNGSQTPLIFAASCAISFFDDPKREGMSEDFLAMQGGAIATIAATRLVYSQPNASFNRAVFDVMFNNDSLSMCEALYATKLQRQYINPTYPVPNTNDRNYLYFGDPFMKLGLPSINVVADSALDSLKALQPVTITGRIEDDFGSTYISDGRLEISVFDSERKKTHNIVAPNGTVLLTVPYTITGTTLFKGSATITGGNFSFTFIPPLDIGYGGNGARVSMYAVLDTVDAAGILDSISVASSVATSTDSIGPDIQVSFAGRPLIGGGAIVLPGENMDIVLVDSSGINSTGALGHGITLEIDGEASSLKSLSELFSYYQDDYTTGTINYSLGNIEPGLHSFKLKAWDNANNSSTLSFNVEITGTTTLAILDLLNYPNPMSDETSFCFSLTQPVEQFSLEIFTVSGRKINSFDRYALAPSYYNDIIWDGRDAYGDRVATGVYLYKATAVPSAGDRVEEFGKIVLINQ